MAYTETQNKPYESVGDSDLERRRRELKIALSGEQSKTNPDPQTLYNISQFQNELSDIEERIGVRQQSDLESRINAALLPNSEESAIQRKALEDIFGSQESSLNREFSQQRGNTIDELASIGGLRQPGLVTKSLANVDAQRQNALADLFGRKGQAQLGLQDTLFNQGLAKANLAQGGQQFNANLGFQKQQFGESQRQNSLQNIFNQQSIEQADRLGRLQADASKKSDLEKYLGLGSGIGTGIGSILTGIGSARGPSKGTVK